jgi:prolyl-tRNA editing enzyme YbaK/EbsC (Cys-tRNA(Pro) deacylase)
MEEFSDPLRWLRVFDLPAPVVSCEDAADAKGIALERELKSLVLETDAGFVVAHMPGTYRISLRAVKRALSAAQARLATQEALERFGTSPGTVCPFLRSLWSLPQLIDPRLFLLRWVSTNAGDRKQYVVFDPILLSRAERVQITQIGKVST